MAHAQKPDFVFPLNGRVHLNRWGRQFSRLLAAEVCASAWVMLDRPLSEVAWEYWLPTPFASFPFTSPPVRHRVPPGSERALAAYCWGTRWRSWLSHCATNRKDEGSIPNGVIGIFYRFNPSCRTTALGSIQEHFLGGWRRPVRRADNLTTFMCRMSRSSRSTNLPEP